MDFFIRQNATLPLLKMQIVKDGRSDYDNFTDLIESSTILFTMIDTESGIAKIVSKPAGFVSKTFVDPNTPTEYYIYYQFSKRDTNKPGRYEGQFLLKNEQGDLIVPIREPLYINIDESFISDDVCCSGTTIINPEPNTLPNPLGRIHTEDVRDLNYLIADHLPQAAAPTVKKTQYWQDNIWNGNQGNAPQCVGYAWAHFIEDGPILHNGIHPVVSPVTIYKEAQKIDEWPGENYAGTSVRAGAKYLKSINKISSYLWAYDVTTLKNTVLNTGPVVVGTNWYYNMFFPDRNGLIRIGGYVAGGHAYVINGVDTVKQQFRLKNSWGTKWGQGGHAYISFTDMARLIRERGEVCLAVENRF
jgi:hypothetical protein